MRRGIGRYIESDRYIYRDRDRERVIGSNR